MLIEFPPMKVYPLTFFDMIFVYVAVLRPSQPIWVIRARSVYLTTLLLGRLSPLSG